LKRYGKRKEPFTGECIRGDVGSGNIIKQTFQEIYLGQTLFTEIYDIEPRFHRADGLINRESLLIDGTILESLALRHTLAIATGRPRVEADYSNCTRTGSSGQELQAVSARDESFPVQKRQDFP
jgi:hypothetical protein